MAHEPKMKGQLGCAGRSTKGSKGRQTTPVIAATSAVAIFLSPPILTKAFQAACSAAASRTSRMMTTGETKFLWRENHRWTWDAEPDDSMAPVMPGWRAGQAATGPVAA